MSPDFEWAVAVCQDRVARAAEIRSEIGQEWSAHLGNGPRGLGLVGGEHPHTFVLALQSREAIPTRLSTLFGEWLYELRAALDGLVYYLAVRDSGQSPPPADRGLMFPIFTDAAKYDDPSHRGRLQALSNDTFDLLRHVQPFNARPDHFSNVLWWLEELARIDRHRYGHALAPHIDRVRVGIEPPVQMTRHFLPEPMTALAFDGTDDLPLMEFSAPEGWGIDDVLDHLDVADDAAQAFLDVPGWRSQASRLMSSLTLERRMVLCEEHVLHGIINPLATGDIRLSPDNPDGVV